MSALLQLKKKHLVGFMWVFFLFIYIFNIAIFFKFGFLIFLFSLFGLFFVFNSFHKFRKIDFYIFLFLFFGFFVSALSALFNNNLDYSYYYEVYLFVYFQLLALIGVFRIGDAQLDFVRAIKLSAIAVLIQLILSALISFYPAFEKIFYSIIYNNLSDLSRLDDLKLERIVGVGRSFFASGIINCFILVCLSQIIKYEKKHIIFWLFVYFMIAIIGMMSARTTLVGFAIGCLLLFSSFSINQVKIFFSGLFFLSIVVILYFVYGEKFVDFQLIKFGFGLFLGGGDSDANNSFNTLLNMFSILPESYKTWIIGDNMYNLKNGYYMNTDVGYSRVIFANGLLGLSVFLIFNMYLIFKIKSPFVDLKFKIALLVLLLVLLAKGITVFISLLMLLVYACKAMRRCESEKYTVCY